MRRGRPKGSRIRQNIVNILGVIGEIHGYELWKAYKAIYGEVSQRSIYYQLHAGISTKEIKKSRIVKEEGNYTWGSSVEKTMYALGEKANPSTDPKIKEQLKAQGFFKKPKSA